jgi:hypothetical protein
MGTGKFMGLIEVTGFAGTGTVPQFVYPPDTVHLCCSVVGMYPCVSAPFCQPEHTINFILKNP